MEKLRTFLHTNENLRTFFTKKYGLFYIQMKTYGLFYRKNYKRTVIFFTGKIAKNGFIL